jgi:hypothetical protein
VRPAALLAGLAAAFLATAALAQDLVIRGLDGAERTISAAEIAALPRAEVQVTWGEKTRAFAGPRLAHVLRAAGQPVGARLHGQLATFVVVEGADGFRAVYSLAELDADLHAGKSILADRVDGAPLAGKEAPWRLVAEGDLKPWRSVYAVRRVELKSATAN